MNLQLEGKTAIVTGGSSGIGRAVAKMLAEEGANAVVVARSAPRLAEAARALSEEAGRQVLPMTADVTSSSLVDQMVAQIVETFGRIDILVNGAARPGGLATGPLPKITDEAMMADLNEKFMGYLRCSRAVAPHMQKQGWGRIIHIGGLAGRQAGAYSAGARNIAIVHMSKTMSEELGPFGITVNVVHPGGTRNTPSIDKRIADIAKQENKLPEDISKAMGQGNAIRRLATAEEVASLVVFLASQRAASITGEVIAAGGGSSQAIYL